MVSRFRVGPISKRWFLKKSKWPWNMIHSMTCRSPSRLYIHLAFTYSLRWSLKRSVKRTWTGSAFSTNESAWSVMVTGSQSHVWSGPPALRSSATVAENEVTFCGKEWREIGVGNSDQGDPSVCMSNRLHVDILRFSFIKLRCILWNSSWMICNFVWQSWTSTGHFSNSTGSFVRNCRFFSLIIGWESQEGVNLIWSSYKHIIDISTVVLVVVRLGLPVAPSNWLAVPFFNPFINGSFCWFDWIQSPTMWNCYPHCMKHICGFQS